MLYTKTDSSKYISEFKDRFSNFAQKAPILLSFTTTATYVQIKHENSGTLYTFDWDFTIPVKSFIHDIKQVLSDLHYPRVELVHRSQVPVSAEKVADIAAKGVDLSSIPSTEIIRTSEMFRIDRVIALKDIFIIQSEVTKKLFRYQMNYSSIFFLKNYRSGKYASAEEAGNVFFSKSTLLNEIERKDG